MLQKTITKYLLYKFMTDKITLPIARWTDDEDVETLFRECSNTLRVWITVSGLKHVNC